MNLIDTQTSRVIAKALDGVSKRHSAIVSNVANAETVGYRSIEVSFEENLKQAIQAESNQQQGKTSRYLPAGSLQTSNAKHINPRPIASSISSASPTVEQSPLIYRYDKNGVDIEKQMAELARNTQRYMALSRMENKAFDSLRNVIKGGGY